MEIEVASRLIGVEGKGEVAVVVAFVDKDCTGAVRLRGYEGVEEEAEGQQDTKSQGGHRKGERVILRLTVVAEYGRICVERNESVWSTYLH